MKTVLIVEDSPTQAARVKHFLSSHYTVMHAKSASEALVMGRDNPPDIVVTDVAMPEMDGFELCKRINRDPILKEVPVLLLTGLSEPEDIIWGLEAGADSYLTKPYDDEELLSRIGFVLENAARRDPATERTNPIRVAFLDKDYTIASSRRQILGLLLSTYESSAKQNKRLNREQLELRLEIKQLNYDVQDMKDQVQYFLKTWPGPVLVLDETGDPIWTNESAQAFGTVPRNLHEMKRFRSQDKNYDVNVLSTMWEGEQAYLVCCLGQ